MPKKTNIVGQGWAVVTHFQRGQRHFSEIHVGPGTKREKDLAKRCWPPDVNPEIVYVQISEVPLAQQ